MKSAVAAAFLLFASLSFAQVPDKRNVYIGYSYAHLAAQNTNGWNGSLEGRVLPFMSLVADFNGSYVSNHFAASISSTASLDMHETIRIHTFLFGPRAFSRVGRSRPFGHVLLGLARNDVSFDQVITDNGVVVPDGTFHFSGSTNRFAVALGGGMDLRLTRTLDWRLQADYIRVAPGRSDGSNNARVSTGLIFRF
jgi:opacity protein-like surface antigen